jgi:hypothetical protein
MPAEFSAPEDNLFYSDDELPAHGDGPASNLVLSTSDLPVIYIDERLQHHRDCVLS